MKKFNVAEIVELNINCTEDGFFDWNWESPFDLLSNKKKQPVTPVDPVTPVNPVTPENPVNPVEPEVQNS